MRQPPLCPMDFNRMIKVLNSLALFPLIFLFSFLFCFLFSFYFLISSFLFSSLLLSSPLFSSPFPFQTKKGANYHWLGATLSQFMGQLPDESEVSRFVSMVPTKKWAMNEPNSPSLSAQVVCFFRGFDF